MKKGFPGMDTNALRQFVSLRFPCEAALKEDENQTLWNAFLISLFHKLMRRTRKFVCLDVRRLRSLRRSTWEKGRESGLKRLVPR